MPIRALIVLLIALNVGAAAWWITRPPAPPGPLPPPLPGVPRLQLLSERAVPASTVVSKAAAPPLPMTPVAAVASAATPPAPPSQCFRLGPFVDTAGTIAAGARLGAQVTRKLPRQVPGKAASGYNVLLPPAADREAAQTLAQRIGAAGFDDYLVVNSGDQLNGIALGRYGSREAAERRQSALSAAGFAAQLQAIGQEGAAQWWLDVEAPAAIGPQLKTLAGSAQSRPLDCATLR